MLPRPEAGLTLTATFAHAIRDDIVLHQGKDVLDEPRNGTIMLRLMPQYLYFCLKKRRDVNEELPVREEVSAQTLVK
jgi:hypothetical protein